jgi:uncharacterized protein YhbP (UPF0306 family)
MAALEDKAAAIIASNRYLTLATMGQEGPWASPLAFTLEPDFSLVFYSALEAIHCRNIAANSQVGGAIFDLTKPSDNAAGVQFAGHCAVIAEADLEPVMKRYFEQSFPDPAIRRSWLRPAADFSGAAPQRFYRIEIASLFMPDPKSVKVDRRVELNIGKVAQTLRAQLQERG